MPAGRESTELAFDLETPPEQVAEHVRALAVRLGSWSPGRPVLVEHVWTAPHGIGVYGLPARWGIQAPTGPSRPGPLLTPDCPMEPARELWRTSRFLVAGAVEPARPDPDVLRSLPRTSEEPAPELPVELAARGWVASQTHWSSEGTGRLLVAFRVWIAGEQAVDTAGEVGAAVLDRLERAGCRSEVRELEFRPRYLREWRSGAWRALRPELRWSLDPSRAARVALLGGFAPPPDPGEAMRHTMVFGASGSGKSSFLAAVARDRIRRRQPVVVLDVHGDLSRRIVDGLSPSDRESVVGIDPTTDGPIPGLRSLGSVGPAAVERAHLLAALRRLGQEDGALFWGFRLDRIFDVLIRAVQEQHGDLGDLYALLTDPGCRELARQRTRLPEVTRFLEEIPGLLRRNPEFLWPAAARLSRIALTPRLLATVAPAGPELPVRALLDAGRSILWRFPVGELGPEGAQLLSTLILTRLVLGEMTGARPERRSDAGVAIVLDEAQLVAPRLLSELLAEGRKFGLAVYAATQFPERLEEEARGAAAGAAGTHLLFRTPLAHARELARWSGLTAEEAEQLLPRLPAGTALQVRSGPGARRRLVTVPPVVTDSSSGWEAVLARSRAEFGAEVPEERSSAPELEEQLLLDSLVAAEAPGARSIHPPIGPESAVAVSRSRLLALGELVHGPDGDHISDRGRLRLGYHPWTGATRESAAHRELLLSAFLVFARHGHRLEILRQDRFDARRPDARWASARGARQGTLLSSVTGEPEGGPGSWAWRYSRGREIHVEAEVSGADRPERIRYDLAKGRRAGAFVLFLVGDPSRARRVRTTLRAAGAPRGDWAVWTLRPRWSSGESVGTPPGKDREGNSVMECVRPNSSSDAGVPLRACGPSSLSRSRDSILPSLGPEPPSGT